MKTNECVFNACNECLTLFRRVLEGEDQTTHQRIASRQTLQHTEVAMSRDEWNRTQTLNRLSPRVLWVGFDVSPTLNTPPCASD